MIVISPGVSVVAAGLVSGLCFILINGFRRGRSAQPGKDSTTKLVLDDSRCICCLKPFVIGRGIECGECGSRACRKGCTRWDTEENAWHCLFCHQRRLWLRRNDKWFETFGGHPVDHEIPTDRFRTAKPQVLHAGADHAGAEPGAGFAAGGYEDGNAVERVREFIEKIVDSLVGNVDESPIDKLYDHAAYDRIMDNYKEPLAGALTRLAVSLHLSINNKPPDRETPTMAHAALRDLVDRAVEEAKKLPGMGGSEADRSDQTKDVSDQTYEDLLATAIINKVIEKYQHERVDGNSNTLHGKKISSKQKYNITSEIEIGLDEGVEDGSSSLEPLSQDEYSSDCSVPVQNFSLSRQEPLSLTIEEHIEEVTTTYTSDEDRDNNESGNSLDFRNARRVPFPEFGMDIIDPSQESSEEAQDDVPGGTHIDLVTPVESWEENWLFQKKKMQAQAEPVSMLVPNPSRDFRPLIGDQEADDTSDLSECSAQSDDEIEEELFEAINNVVPRPSDDPKARHFDSENGSIARTETKLTDELKKVRQIEPRKRDASNGETKEEKKIVELNFVPRNSDGWEPIEWEKRANIGNDAKEVNEVVKIVERSSKSGLGDEVNVNRDVDMEQEKFAGAMNSTISTIRDDIGPRNVSRLDLSGTEETRLVDGASKRSEIYHVASTKISVNEEDLPKTPIPSPTTSQSESENDTVGTTTRTDLSSLDEKLVSIESRLERNGDTLEATLRKYVTGGKNQIQASFERGSISLPETDSNPVGKEQREETTSTVKIKLAENSLNNGDGAQRESEYTEHYATATQRRLDTTTGSTKYEFTKLETKNTIDDNERDVPPPIPSTPPPIARLRQPRGPSPLVDPLVGQLESSDRKKVEIDLFLATPPRPGTIAEREHKKWENALPIENNPYSEENIQKRLWQRQYSRRASSEISAETTEPKIQTGVPLQVVLGAGQPDYKRYGRDYYINDAKTAAGIRPRRSANSGRSNSSLSQNSSLHEDDLEPQERTECQALEAPGNTAAEIGTKVAMWQQNNISSDQNVEIRSRHKVETTIQLGGGPPRVEINEVNVKSNVVPFAKSENSWEERKTEEFLENERRNSKNEINAKLNNQEEPERISVTEITKSSFNGNKKSINRIDLKAYGFEKETRINGNSIPTSKQTRVINKLDLKSLGYESDLDRNQFPGSIDANLNKVTAKSRIVTTTIKSNLTERFTELEKSKSSNNLAEYRASDDYDGRKTTASYSNRNEQFSEALNKFGGMTLAKSMPNVAKIQGFSQNIVQTSVYRDDEQDNASVSSSNNESDGHGEERLRRGMIGASSNNRGVWKSETFILSGEKSRVSDSISSDDERDLSLTRHDAILSRRELFARTEGQDITDDLPMPSVRRLAQAFIKTPERHVTSTTKIVKSTSTTTRKERPTTPEIHIVETPRQMHSLTARSISREFREGLRQIPNKIPSGSGSLSIVELNANEHRPRDAVSEVDGKGDDVAVIAPGKLKSNIKFWEQLQKDA